MEENLLGHLLKANDPTTQADVERLLATDATAREQLEQLRRVLAPLAADKDDAEPPPDLVMRTIAAVAEHIVRHEVPDRPRTLESICVFPKSAPAVVLPSEALPSGIHRRSLLTSIGLTIAVLALVFPAVVHVRNHNKLITCQNNLRQFHEGLVVYSATNGNQFPQVKDNEQVLTVGRNMAVEGYLPPSVMNCPMQVPPETTPIVLASYAYSLGYRDGDTLYGLTNEAQNSVLPILADAPQRQGCSIIPVNHRYGQNVLFVDGNVRFCKTPYVGVGDDNIFCNAKDQVGAGLTRWDSVLGRAEEKP